MKITILGCGYVGMAIANYWRSHSNHILTATTTTPERLAELGEIAHHSVLLKGFDAVALHRVIQDQEAIVVSIAPRGNQQVDAEQYEQTYLQTANNLAATIPKLSALRQIIYTGSCAVYGNAHGAWVDETTAVSLNNHHSEILYKVEQTLLSVSSPSLQVCVFRMGAIYGPGREIKPRFESLAGTARPGNGEHFTNWIHLDDIVAAITFALNHQLQGIYNLVNDTPITAHKLFQQVCQKYNLPPIMWDPSLPRSRTNDRRVLNQKLKQQGFSFLHPEIEI
jgi:nucleoside-diphosphate-sugar epimerase